LIPRAHSAVCGVENPGFAAPPIPRAGGAVCGVENPGFAVLALRGDVAAGADQAIARFEYPH
jgi:hypothetical protein